MSFPSSFVRFCGQRFLEAADKELADACVKAYNDWQFDEWCGDSNGRLIPLAIVQLWDPQLAAAEVRRNAERGGRAITFSEIPPYLGLPSIHDADGHWDPLFAACAETGTVVNMHIGSSSKMPSASEDISPSHGHMHSSHRAPALRVPPLAFARSHARASGAHPCVCTACSIGRRPPANSPVAALAANAPPPT